MKKYLIRILPVLIIGIMAAGTAMAQTSQSSGADSPKQHDQWLQELNLTPTQKEQLQVIKNKYKDDMKKQRETMRQARQALQTALQSDASDASLRKQFKALQKQHEEFASLRFEKVLAIRAILTPEQRKQFQAMRQHHHRHHER